MKLKGGENLEALTFKLRGTTLSVLPSEALALLQNGAEIHSRARGKKPDYFVVVSGRKVPVKAALERILRAKGSELTLLDFTTQDAVRIFRRLGFPIVKGEGRKSSLMRYVGALSLGGDAVRDKRGIYR